MLHKKRNGLENPFLLLLFLIFFDCLQELVGHRNDFTGTKLFSNLADGLERNLLDRLEERHILIKFNLCVILDKALNLAVEEDISHVIVK